MRSSLVQLNGIARNVSMKNSQNAQETKEEKLRRGKLRFAQMTRAVYNLYDHGWMWWSGCSGCDFCGSKQHSNYYILEEPYRKHDEWQAACLRCAIKEQGRINAQKRST